MRDASVGERLARRPRALALFAAAVLAGAAACGVADEAASGRGTGGGVISGVGPTDEGLNATGSGAGSGAVTGLPCDVQQVFENRCIGCHLGPSPAALLTYDDLKKPSKDPSKTLAQASVERMKSTTNPMPPAPALAATPEEIAVVEAWVNAGAAKGDACTTPGAANPATNYNTPLQCTSGRTWGGGEENSSMDPGRACITCHTRQGGPNFTIAGTVYPSAHEPNDCYGVSGGLSVVVTDKAGKVVTLTVNGAGNFSSKQAITPPFSVKVTGNGKERVMMGTLTAGDCNSCHTPTGANGAPGRIMAP